MFCFLLLIYSSFFIISIDVIYLLLHNHLVVFVNLVFFFVYVLSILCLSRCCFLIPLLFYSRCCVFLFDVFFPLLFFPLLCSSCCSTRCCPIFAVAVLVINLFPRFYFHFFLLFLFSLPVLLVLEVSVLAIALVLLLLWLASVVINHITIHLSAKLPLLCSDFLYRKSTNFSSSASILRY